MGDSGNHILLVFVHGFKGDDTTFHKFPERVNHIVQETFPDSLVCESVVFPAYETKGDLGAATDAFIDWLATVTVEKENQAGQGGGAGKARIVLCGHSMGGLLAADALLKIARSRPEQSTLLWPRIIGLIAFDTPYLGLHPSVFKHTFTKTATHLNQAKEVASTVSVLAPAFLAYAFGSKKSAPAAAAPAAKSVDGAPTSPEAVPPAREYFDPFGGGEGGGDTHFNAGDVRRGSAESTTTRRASTAGQPTPQMAPAAATGWARFSTPALFGLGTVAVAAAAGGAYMKRQDLGAGMNWAQDHLRFLGNLWDGDQMKTRLEALEALVEDEGIVFRNYYTLLPQTKGYLLPRTFCVLPQPGGPTRGLWVSAKNSVAKSEVDAHCEMFAPLSNDNYFDLGLRVSETISLSITQSRRRDSLNPTSITTPLASVSLSPVPSTDSSGRRASYQALSPNLGGSSYASAGGVGGVSLAHHNANGRRRSSLVPEPTSLGLGIGEFGAKAEERRRVSVANGSVLDEEDEGSDDDTIGKGASRKGSGASSRKGKNVAFAPSGIQVETPQQTSERMRREVSEEEESAQPLVSLETPVVEDEDPLSKIGYSGERQGVAV